LAAVLFDMDGLMIDSEPVHYRAYREILEPLGVRLCQEENDAFIGQSDLVLAEHVVSSHGLSVSAAELHEMKSVVYRKLLIEECEAMAGLPELLAVLRERGTVMAVVSNSALREIEIVVDALGIGGFFRGLFSAEHVRRGKPYPDCYLFAAERLGIQPVDCLVLEDSPAGARAALSAGMGCFAVPGPATSGGDFPGAVRIFPSLMEVAGYFLES
jgi:HAD superfamily hydrolase (TIGR01509 family)